MKSNAYLLLARFENTKLVSDRIPNLTNRGPDMSETPNIDRPRYTNLFVDSRGQSRIVFRKRGRPRITLPGLPGQPEFDQAYAAAMAGLSFDKQATPRRLRGFNRQRPSNADLALWAKQTITRLAQSASKRGLNVEIKPADLIQLVEATDARCAVTGVPLVFPERGKGWPISAYAISIDRIDNRQGYIPGNIRLICYAMNVAFMHWGEDAFAGLAKAFLERREAARS